jgi:hypothetical protein
MIIAIFFLGIRKIERRSRRMLKFKKSPAAC